MRKIMTNLEQLLLTAQRVPMTDEEAELFAHGHHIKAIKMISERTKIPLSSGRVAFAPALKCLLIID
jgi:hypothetical protein